jgi:hypothetical protein
MFKYRLSSSKVIYKALDRKMIVTGEERRQRKRRMSEEKNQWVILHVDVAITIKAILKIRFQKMDCIILVLQRHSNERL